GLHLDRTEELVPPSRRTTELRASVCLHQTRSWWQPRLELGPPARLALEGAEELDGREVVRDLAHESVVLAPVSPRLHGAMVRRGTQEPLKTPSGRRSVPPPARDFAPRGRYFRQTA